MWFLLIPALAGGAYAFSRLRRTNPTPVTPAQAPNSVSVPAVTPQAVPTPGAAVPNKDWSVATAAPAASNLGATPYKINDAPVVTVLDPRQPLVIAGPPPAPGMAPQYRQPVYVPEFMVNYWQRSGVTPQGTFTSIPEVHVMRALKLAGRANEYESPTVLRITNGAQPATVRAWLGQPGKYSVDLGGEAGLQLAPRQVIEVRESKPSAYISTIQVLTPDGWTGLNTTDSQSVYS